MRTNKFIDFFGVALAVERLVKIDWDNQAGAATAHLAGNRQMHEINVSDVSLNELDEFLGGLFDGVLVSSATERVWVRADRVLTVGSDVFPEDTTKRCVTVMIDAPTPTFLKMGVGDPDFVEGFRKEFVGNLEKVIAGIKA